MRHGQIGTDSTQRVIFVWEGAVATLPPSRVIRGLERMAISTGQNRRAVDYWKVRYHALALMWTLWQRTTWRIDLCVTTRSAPFTRALTRKVNDENWPIHFVWNEPAVNLGRRLAVMPDVERVYYGLEEQRFAFGPNGQCLHPDMPIAWQ